MGERGKEREYLKNGQKNLALQRAIKEERKLSVRLYTPLMKSMIRQSRALVAKEKNESMMEKVERRKEGRKNTLCARAPVHILYVRRAFEVKR